MDTLSLQIKGDEKKDHNPSLLTDKDFILYTMDLSYFSGKMEMYLRYKEINFERIEPHAEEFDSILCKNTGTEQLPQLYDCRQSTDSDKRWLRDTTPMIEYIEKDKSIKSLSVIPECEVQAFFQYIFEDYADEYLWRPAMFWRWAPTFDRNIMGQRFYWEFARTTQFRFIIVPKFMRPYLLSLRQWLLSVYGEDCITQDKKDVVINQYYELLEVLENILQKQLFLFGNHPTLVDFGFAGPFFRHFSSDFTPRKIMQQKAPAVYEWLARLWNCKNSKLTNTLSNFPPAKTLPDNWEPLMKMLPDYFHYYSLNAKAHCENKKSFKWDLKGQTFNVPMVPYRVWCKKELHKKYNNCTEESQKTIKNIMKNYDCWDMFEDKQNINIEPECGAEPPFVCNNPKSHQLSYKWDPTYIFTSYFMETGLMISGCVGIIATGLLVYKRLSK